MPSIYKIMSPAYANSIKVVSPTVGQSQRYLTQNFDQTFWKNQFLNWQNSSCYAQKWHVDDTTAFEIHTNSNQQVRLYLMDQFGKMMIDYTSTRQNFTFSGNSIIRDNITFPLFTAIFIVSFTGLPSGFYYLKLEVDYDTTGTVSGADETGTYISEPMYVADTQPNTILLDYTNDKIAFNTYFENYHFRMRLEGSIHYDSADSVDSQYNDEYFNLRLLNSYTYRKFKLYIGGTAGIPNWLMDKLNIVVGCNSLKIDSSFYTKDEGAKFNFFQNDNRFFSDIMLREASNYFDATVTEKSGLVIMQIPTTDSALREVSLGASKWQMAYIINPNAIASLLLYLNTDFIVQSGARGYFTRTANTIIYIQDATENYTTAGSVVLTQIVNITHTRLNLPAQNLDLNIEMSYAVVDWGDGWPANGSGTGTNINVHLLHNYSITGQKTIKIYHDNSFKLLTLSESSTTNVWGDFGTGFQSISLLAGNLGSFNMADIDNCKGTLLQVIYNNCNMTDILNLSCDYPLIQKIDVKNNKLGKGTVNAIAIQMDSAAMVHPSLQSGTHTLAMQNQNPLAPLCTNGTNAAQHLRNVYNWTVTND